MLPLRNNTALFVSLLLTGLVFFACRKEAERLPILGNTEVLNGDTIFHTVEDIPLIDQDSQVFQLSKMGDKVFIADFFFISCPTICPKVKKQMMRLYEQYKHDDRVMLLSHTIDPRHDSVPVLKRYADNLGVSSESWKFLYGSKDTIYDLADQYFVSVVDDPSAPMGFDHSGRLILLDRNRHVRGFAEGTDPKSVSEFFHTIDQLLREEYAQ